MPNSNPIEYANMRCKFTEAEIRAQLAESKAYWSSPEGIAEKRRQEEADRTREYRGIKFPDLAAKGTRPTIATRSAPPAPAATPRANGWRKMLEILH